MLKNLFLAGFLLLCGPQMFASEQSLVGQVGAPHVLKRTAKTARNLFLHTASVALQASMLLDAPDDAEGFRRRRRGGGFNDDDDGFRHHDNGGRQSSCKSGDKACIIASSVVACVALGAFGAFAWYIMRDHPACPDCSGCCDCSDCCSDCSHCCSGCSVPSCSNCLPATPNCCKSNPNKVTLLKAIMGRLAKSLTPTPTVAAANPEPSCPPAAGDQQAGPPPDYDAATAHSKEINVDAATAQCEEIAI